MPKIRPRNQLTETDDILAGPIQRALEIDVALQFVTDLADDYPPRDFGDARRGWDRHPS